MKKSFSIGTWITVGNFEFSEIIFKSQFDWICIDLEHSTIDLDSYQTNSFWVQKGQRLDLMDSSIQLEI